MEKMSEDYRKFSWGDVSTIVYAVIFALYVTYRRMDNPPQWLLGVIAVMILLKSMSEIVYYFKQTKRGKRRIWSLIFSALVFLCGIMFLLNAFGLLGE